MWIEGIHLVCVEIDLSLHVVGNIFVRGIWHKIKYKGLHILHSQCGSYDILPENAMIRLCLRRPLLLRKDGMFLNPKMEIPLI
jgi:hypothetical protein